MPNSSSTIRREIRDSRKRRRSFWPENSLLKRRRPRSIMKTSVVRPATEEAAVVEVLSVEAVAAEVAMEEQAPQLLVPVNPAKTKTTTCT
jgi:hypothetical protein